MPFGIEKHIEDQVALRGALQARALEVFVEYLVFFSFHRRRTNLGPDYTRASPTINTPFQTLTRRLFEQLRELRAQLRGDSHIGAPTGNKATGFHLCPLGFSSNNDYFEKLRRKAGLYWNEDGWDACAPYWSVRNALRKASAEQLARDDQLLNL